MFIHPRYSVVIPFYQEGETVEKMITAVRTAMTGMNEPYEIICIDDGSPDTTWDTIQRIANANSDVRAIRFSRNFGKESAICAGLEIARGDFVMTIDGDLQHPPELIPEFIRIQKETGAHIVDGVKVFRGKEPFITKLGVRAFYFLINKLSGYDLAGASDYKLLSRSALNAWCALPEKRTFYRGMSAWIGFKRAEVRFSVAPRRQGMTKWSFIRLAKLGISSITSFSSLPLHFVTLLGFLFLLFAIGLGIQTIYRKFTGTAVSGFTTVILLQLIIGSLVMIGVGIAGEYIGKIYDEVKYRPRYIIAEKINCEDDKEKKI
jgi:dolichol-phosphate mannosyltransferase